MILLIADDFGTATRNSLAYWKSMPHRISGKKAAN
jgi:hypothetical protein